MFDPTIYENLKVVVEGSVYDLDEVGAILVTNREDTVDLATMSRRYVIEFREKADDAGDTLAEIGLIAGMKDLAAEILHGEEKLSGCQIEIKFKKHIKDIEKECKRIEELLAGIWQNRPRIAQSLTFPYPNNELYYLNRIELDFGRKINEEQIEDINMLIDHVVHSLQRLNELKE